MDEWPDENRVVVLDEKTNESNLPTGFKYVTLVSFSKKVYSLLWTMDFATKKWKSVLKEDIEIRMIYHALLLPKVKVSVHSTRPFRNGGKIKMNFVCNPDYITSAEKEILLTVDFADFELSDVQFNHLEIMVVLSGYICLSSCWLRLRGLLYWTDCKSGCMQLCKKLELQPEEKKLLMDLGETMLLSYYELSQISQ